MKPSTDSTNMKAYIPPAIRLVAVSGSHIAAASGDSTLKVHDDYEVTNPDDILSKENSWPNDNYN